MKVLVCGGMKSGKSRFAEQRILEISGIRIPLYLATTELPDEEMRARMAEHQRRRGNTFMTVEEPLHLMRAIEGTESPVLVECVTMWLNNWLHHGFAEEKAFAVISGMLEMKRDFVFVQNEVGLGVIPDNPLARMYADISGRIGQMLGERCDEIWFCVAGHPLRVK